MLSHCGPETLTSLFHCSRRTDLIIKMPTGLSAHELGHLCRSGDCPVRSSPFTCPFSLNWPDTAYECGSVTADMWSQLQANEPLSDEEEAERDIIHFLVRKGHVERLVAELSEHDLINRMSMEGELAEIAKSLERLASEHPKAMQKVLHGC